MDWKQLDIKQIYMRSIKPVFLTHTRLKDTGVDKYDKALILNMYSFKEHRNKNTDMRIEQVLYLRYFH